MGSLSGKVAIVTGASQGFGKEVAKKFVLNGASIVICGRNVDLLKSAHEEISSLVGGSQIVEVIADVSCAADCQKLVNTTLDRFGKIDVLVNNAGVYGPKGAIEEVDWNDWLRSIEINLFGSIHMCRSVLPHMKKERAGKIIQLSGGGATKPMPLLSAYATAKAAIVRFAETLAEETREFGIDVNSVAPGALNTRLLDEVLAAGPDQVGAAFYAQSMKQKESGGTDLTFGVNLCLFLASAASNGITGKLISAVWDPWESLPDHKAELASDIYTLRRITPKDRGQTWGNDQ